MKNEKKKRAITDLNAPNISRHIPFPSQEFDQDGRRHFVGFQPHFLLKYDVTDALLLGNENMKVQYFRSLLFDLLETLQVVKKFRFISKVKVQYLRSLLFDLLETLQVPRT